MDLSKEDRERIIAEEKLRYETQSGLQAETKRKEDARQGIAYIVLLLIIGGLVWNRWPTISTMFSPKAREASAAEFLAKLGTNDLQLVKFEWKSADYGRKLVGTIRNPSPKQYTYAVIEFSLYDKTGGQVGTAIANISNLEGNGIWNFEALVLEEKATEAKFKGITAY